MLYLLFARLGLRLKPFSGSTDLICSQIAARYLIFLLNSKESEPSWDRRCSHDRSFILQQRNEWYTVYMMSGSILKFCRQLVPFNSSECNTLCMIKQDTRGTKYSLIPELITLS